MGAQREVPFYINGTESYLHCFRCSEKANPNFLSPLYHYHEYVEMLYFIEGGGRLD